MQNYVNHENIKHYQKLIAVSEGDLSRDEARHQMLLRLLAEERAKDERPYDWPNVCSGRPGCSELAASVFTFLLSCCGSPPQD
jgi:hypothetical protein